MNSRLNELTFSYPERYVILSTVSLEDSSIFLAASTRNQDVVMEFIEAMNNKDIDRIMSFFAEETVYDNKPMDPVRDHESIRAIIESYLDPASEVHWVMINIAEAPNGDVLTERLDRYLLNGSPSVEMTCTSNVITRQQPL